MNYAATLTPPVAVLGAGPAGVTAGYLLARAGVPSLVLEAEDQVGGLAKTVVRDGYRFDLGGHRFFTKSPEVERLWHEVLAEELLVRPRLSRIYWNGRFLDYPLRARDVVTQAGPGRATRASLSYAAAAAAAARRGADLRGVGHEPLRAAALRALLPFVHGEGVGRPDRRDPGGVGGAADQGPLLLDRRRAALLGNRGNRIKSLIEEFHYPRFGPGPDVGGDRRRDRRRAAARCD